MSKLHNRENDTVEVAEESQKSDVALREEAILAFWVEHDIFNKSLVQAAPNGEFIFYDGPPFATGLPHYGHILASTIKDAVPRFWTMNGYHVPRRWGWDCHGLPLENLIEKKLGLATKRDIEAYGVQNFNEAARDTVMEYADDWAKIIPRMGRWADMEHDYKTMDSTYTESVWWVFRELDRKGLVFEGFKSMHLCPRCGTTLSNFEVNQGYKDIKDIAVTVKLPLLDESGAVTDTSLLVWTTTPWTLPGNMAAAVNREFTYAKVQLTTDAGVEYVIVAKGRLAQLGDASYEIVGEMQGEELLGRSYQSPFPYLATQSFDQTNAWKIWHADYVELGAEGTGAVHIAPAYGEDDMVLAKANNIPIMHHVDADGHFMPFVTDFAGKLVKPKDDDAAGVDHKDADIEILKALQAAGKIFKKENITHSYPHCWRCDTPLLNYATTSWFVNVPMIKDRLVAANNQVNWVPEHVGRARFGKWLEGARDWAVSRQRYWGAPLPIWKHPQTGAYKIFGTLEELQTAMPRSGNMYTLMRHAESVSNAGGYTSSDVADPNPLTEHGKKQVHNAAIALKTLGIDTIIASPFERTMETALLVAAELGLPESAVAFDARLGEVQMGVFEGKLNNDYREFIGTSNHWSTVVPEGGESWQQVKDRAGAFLYELEANYQGKNILIVSHNAVLRMLESVATGIPLKDTEFNHDEPGKLFLNTEARPLTFMPMPHNDHFELDFHRPYIDRVTVLDEVGDTLVRIPDVFDCWFESGSMPYGQQHYLGTPGDSFNPETGQCFPAQFIAEGLDQTRGWFYSLIVLGVALFGKSPYENVIVNGLALAEDGKKMSKSLRNYPDPMELVARVGADSMRYYLLTAPIVRGEDLNFSEKEALELQRKNIGRLHNVLAMYEMYADGTGASADSTNVLDRWIVARLNQLIAESTAGYKAYELDRANRPIADFIDDVSVWYLRRSRERLKADDVADKKATLATLRFVLRDLAKVMAPAMPFYAEYLYRAVKAEDEPESVHLTAWPEGGAVDAVVVGEMSVVREFVTLALEARTKANVKVRQPLPALMINIELMPEYTGIVADEVNVKEITYVVGQTERAVLDTTITPMLKAEGEAREFIRAVQEMRKMADLLPGDVIVLTVQGSTDAVLNLSTFTDTIKKTVGAREIVFAETLGTEIKIGEQVLIARLEKVG